jgi:hypothetical protein
MHTRLLLNAKISFCFAAGWSSYQEREEMLRVLRYSLTVDCCD